MPRAKGYEWSCGGEGRPHLDEPAEASDEPADAVVDIVLGTAQEPVFEGARRLSAGIPYR